MTTRERTLGILVGALAAVGVGYGGYAKYRAFNGELARQIHNKEKAILAIENEGKESLARMARWKELGSQTLATDPVRLQNLLRTEADQLAKDCGLQEASVTLGRFNPLGKRSRGQKERVQVLSATVRGEGPVLNIMQFLYRLHAQPYVVRVKNLSLTRPGRNAPKGVLLMTATLETPLLPKTTIPITLQPAKLDPHDRREVRRTLYDDFEVYRKGIVRRKLFEPYEKIVAKATNPFPPAGGPPQYDITEIVLRWKPYDGASAQKLYFGVQGMPPATQPAAELSGSQNQFKPDVKLEIGKSYTWKIDTEYEDELTVGDTWQFRVEKRPEPPPSPGNVTPPVIVRTPDDADFFVGRLISSPLIQQVVLEDRKNPQAIVDKRVELGQDLFDGVLVYIHPKGAVSEKDSQLRMHPLGEQVRSLQPLTENDLRFPDVYFEVMKLRQKVAGITQGPGEGPETGG